ncbi:MAG TPA: urea ABC transporter permease subunit UrtB [Candidatus Agathobaculum merdavium]|nr:urea ABC transporter permease subunit UrtB [Candidatus Agathobaculum merdavium]
MVVFLNALSSSMILILVSLGLGIIFGQMNVFNLAHGEFFMLGAYAAVITGLMGLPPIAGLIFAPLFVGLIGIVVERLLIRPLYARPMDTLLVTWGLSMVLKQLIQLIFGAGHRNADALFTGSMNIFGTEYPIYRIFIIVITLALLGIVFFLYFRTSFGLKMRMVIQNRQQAMAMGINTVSVDRMTFALGSALAGIAGAIMTPLMFISPEMGASYLTNSFIVVIIGGVSSLIGLVGGGMTYGIAKTIIDFVIANSFLTNIIVLLLAIVIIRLKPNGIFTRKSR